MRRLHTIEAVCNEVKAILGIEAVYPSTFPANAPSKCAVVSFMGGQPTRDTVKYATVQIATRADHPFMALTMLTEVLDTFKTYTDVRLANGDLVISFKPQTAYPIYLGEDENRRHTYSSNFFLVLSEE